VACVAVAKNEPQNLDSPEDRRSSRAPYTKKNEVTATNITLPEMSPPTVRTITVLGRRGTEPTQRVHDFWHLTRVGVGDLAIAWDR